KVKKTLSGRAWTTADSFEFTITPIAEAPAFTPNKVTITSADQANDYTKSFGEVTFTKAGTYQWTVTETHKGETIDGIAYDSTDKTVTIKVKDNGKGELVAEEDSALVQTAAFTNNYSKSGEAEIKVKKTFTGREWTTDDSFEFTITPVGDAPAFAENKVTVDKDSRGYTESFGKVTLTEIGTYQWTVSETHKGETIDGIAYDSTDKTISITVKDDGKGHLVAEEGSNLVQTAEFENTYSAEGKAEVKVQKILNGRKWLDSDEFTFTISADEGTPMPANDTITITKADADQTKGFGEMTFTKAGEYVYIVKETKGTLGGVTYDETEHTVTIKAEDNGKGEIVAAADSDLFPVEKITNEYSASGSVKFSGAKTVEGRDFKAGDKITIKLEGENDATPLPETTEVTIEPTSGKSAPFSFGEIGFDLDDLKDLPEGETSKTYTYTVTESAYTMEGVKKKDDTVYTVKATISDNGDGTLKVVDENNNFEGLNFTNKFETEVNVTKKMPTGAVLPGAVLQVTDANGNVVDKWTTTDGAHQVAGLGAGTYVLHEVEVPNVEYFLPAEDITFVVDEDAQIYVNGELVQDITMVDLFTEAGENYYDSDKNKGNTTPDEDEEQNEEDNKKEKQKKKKKSKTTTKKTTQKTTVKKSKGAKTADPTNAALPIAGCAAAIAAALYLFFEEKKRRS
ncbi:MAG: hypothetical protein J6D14_03510, partial [Lachnospiraceae bacterium]|nr:hypothetical protein [Lachnospiraceae bacterium]